MNKELLDKLRTITEEEKRILEGDPQINSDLYMEPSQNIIDNRKMIKNGSLIQIRPHTRFVHFPEHSHNYVEVVYMCEGASHHVVNGEDLMLSKGELLFLNQHAVQEIYPTSENDIAVNFMILPVFFEESLKMMEKEENLIRDFVVDCLKSKDIKSGYLHFKVSEVLPVQNLVENLIWTIMNEQQHKRRINQTTMGLLFLQLMNHTDKVTIGRNYEQEMMLGILRYVEENYKDGELKQLAALMKFDVLTLSRLIKKLTGSTYTELVQTKRLSQACYLLRNTRLSVADIGYSIGYENLSYFYRIFTEKFGKSPRQYRMEER
ncbi:MAG: AraC family transcriptional regulator [Lachnospiraceae bacterium]